MDSAAFDYDLPDASIAQQPAWPRDSSRLLVDGDPPRHARTRDLPDLIRPGDLIVLNDTRVMPARLHLRKDTGGAVEVLALEELAEPEGWWEALVRPSRRVPDGTVLVDHIGLPVLEVGAATGEGSRLVRPVGVTMATLLEHLGSVPLPPYITAPLEDPERYQTVYAAEATSVAAPTAGLHLTPAVLDRCRDAGAEIVTVELSVGVGTFRPIEVDDVDGHTMHSERYRVAPEIWQAVQDAERVVAVGTTVVRTLESVAATGALEGRTELYIRPGHRFGAVDALLTNFHMPRSTLLVMIEAFVGPRWRDLYALAVAEGYRFLSFGDAMFLERGDNRSS
ncbi:MAG: tRNA preQ1(34) S-adenosylmethionine ribosyltransferase-isomerase QueA [Acidimicrobiales bacterium]